MMEEIGSFVKPEFAIIAVALYVIGVCMRHSCRIANCQIPFYLTLCGMGLATLSVLARFSTYANMAAAALDAILQGILCTGMAVYVNQLLKQSKQQK